MSESRKGLILINTGPGKGKTTAALGTALRAVGCGMKVLMLQFLKGSWHYGELDAVEAFGENFVLKQMGRGFVKIGGAETDPEDIRMVEAAWAEAREAIYSGEWDMVVLDEINYAISLQDAGPRGSGRGAEGKAGDGARDPDRPQCASAAGGAGRYRDRDARGETRLPEGNPGAARHRVLSTEPNRWRRPWRRPAHHRWADIAPEQLNPLVTRQYVVGTNTMLARIVLKKGAHVPMHQHFHEQISHVVEGALQFLVEGRESTVRAGEILCIPPHVPHEVTALEDSVALDIFNPPRQDWIDGDDAYLRVAQAADQP